MKRLFIVLAFLAIAMPAFSQTNILTGNVGDYGLNPTNAMVTLTLLSPNPRVVNGFFVRSDPVQQTAQTNGAFAFTNIQWGRYQFTISGQFGTAWIAMIPTNSTGSVPLASYVYPPGTVALPLPNPSTNFYTMTQVDAKLANVVALGVGVTNIIGPTNTAPNATHLLPGDNVTNLTVIGISSPGGPNGSEQYGSNSIASSVGATSIGYGASALASVSTVVGSVSGIASGGTSSVVLGAAATNTGFANSVAIGAGASNTAANQVIFGPGQVITGNGNGLTNINVPANLGYTPVSVSNTVNLAVGTGLTYVSNSPTAGTITVNVTNIPWRQCVPFNSCIRTNGFALYQSVSPSPQLYFGAAYFTTNVGQLSIPIPHSGYTNVRSTLSLQGGGINPGGPNNIPVNFIMQANWYNPLTGFTSQANAYQAILINSTNLYQIVQTNQFGDTTSPRALVFLPGGAYPQTNSFILVDWTIEEIAQ